MTLTLILSFACMIGVGAFITLALCAVASRADEQMEAFFRE